MVSAEIDRMARRSFITALVVTLLVSAAAANPTRRGSTCKKTKVAVLGAGIAGITAAQTLHNNSISDFLIVEYNADIGGRVAHTTFGKYSTGKPYVVELGANWAQGIASPGGPVNPIWILAEKYNLTNAYSKYSSIETFNASGMVDYSNLLNDYSNAYGNVQQDAGVLWANNLQDRSMRAGLSIAGWNPKKDPNAQAAEWWQFDWEYAYLPEQSSEEWAVIVCTGQIRKWRYELTGSVLELQHHVLPV
jgi:polyamine oxidase